MKKFVIFFVFVFWGMVIFLDNAFAASIFDLTLTSEGSGFTENYSQVEDLIDGFDQDYIKTRIPGYTDTSAASARANFRGVPIDLNFTSQSTELILKIPSIGVNESFKGATRDDSVDLLEEWFKSEGGDALTRLMKELVATTPNDPIAGNPNSLMGHIVQSDFESAFTSNVSNLKQVAQIKTDSGENSNLIGIGARFGSYRQGNMDSQHVSVPISYTVRFDNSLNKLKFNLPLTITEVDGAKSYNLGLGIGFGWHLTDKWELTPAVGYSAVASADLGSVGQIASGSLTSAYTFDLGKCDLSMGNMVGYYKTLKFTHDDYSFDPDIANTVFRNGFMLSVPTSNFINRTALEIFITDTRYFGSDLYIDNYNEMGFSFGYTKTQRKTLASKIKNYLKDIRVGLTYLYSDNSKGVSGNVGYTF